MMDLDCKNINYSACKKFIAHIIHHQYLVEFLENQPIKLIGKVSAFMDNRSRKFRVYLAAFFLYVRVYVLFYSILLTFIIQSA